MKNDSDALELRLALIGILQGIMESHVVSILRGREEYGMKTYVTNETEKLCYKNSIPLVLENDFAKSGTWSHGKQLIIDEKR